MFGKCIKNYFYSLKYIFSVLGILFIALLIGGHVLISGTKNTLDDMTTQISQTTGEADLSSDRIWNAIKSNFSWNMDTDNDKLVSGDETQSMVVNSVSDAISETVDNYVNYIAEIGKIISAAIAHFLMLLVFFFIIQVVGVILSRSFVVLFARERIYRKNPFLMFNARLILDIALVLSLVLIGWVTSKIPQAGIALLVIYPVIYCIGSLWTANLSVSKKNRASMSQVLTVKNVLILLVTNILEIVFSAVMAWAVFMVFSTMAAIYINIALLVIASVAVIINADSIVAYCAERKRMETAKKNEEALEVVDMDGGSEEEEAEEGLMDEDFVE